MWYKVFGAIILIIILASAFVIYSGKAGRREGMNIAKTVEADRIAKNITLFELNTENNKTTVLHAEKGLLKEDQELDLYNITVTQEGKFNIKGPQAKYDLEKSNLAVKGDIVLEAKDGSKAYFRDMIWEKATNLIHSENQVRLEKEGGWLTGQKVEMTDDLSIISFSGGVHAKINRDFDIGS